MKVRTLLKIAGVAGWNLLTCFALFSASQAQSATLTNFSPNFGVVGSTVTIYGNNFGTQTGSVTFNGTAVTQGTWGSKVITVTVPTGATTGLVKVTPSGGTGVTSTAAFNVLATNATLVMGAFPPQAKSCSDITGYSGSNCIADYQTDVIKNGGADGVVITVPWSKIDLGNSANSGPGCPSDGTSSATCDWGFLDTYVSNYVSGIGWNSKKKIGIVLSPVTDGGPNASTPTYVLKSAWATSLGVSTPVDQCTCTSNLAYSGDSGAPAGCWNASTNSDTSGAPAGFEKPFYVALEDFYQSAVNHFNSQVNYLQYLSYVRFGLSGGGETLPYCYEDMKNLAGVVPHTVAQYETVWTGYANTMYVYEAGLKSQVPIIAAPNGGQDSNITDDWGDKEAQYALTAGLSLGSQGLQFQDTIHVFTGLPCSNDWCATFSYTPVPQIKQQQTLKQSNYLEGVCGSNTSHGGNYHDTASLACLLPFIEGKSNSVELYPEDMFAAFDSTNYTGYVSSYATYIANAQSGH